MGLLSRFEFHSLPSSKALVLRAALLKSFLPDLEIIGQNHCDDVQLINNGITAMFANRPIHCGFSAAVLRFLTLRASRIPGRHLLYGAPRLFQRPTRPLFFVLEQLGIRIELGENSVLIDSQGWKPSHSPIQVPVDTTSQVASGLLLSSWELDFDLQLEFTGTAVSKGFLDLTLSLLQSAELHILHEKDFLLIPQGQTPRLTHLPLETDMSLAFTLSSFGVLLGEVDLSPIPSSSQQSDYEFLSLLERMNVEITRRDEHTQTVTVRQPSLLKPIDVSLRSCSDLFPSLSVLCAFANGTSRIYDTPQLAHKESNRLQMTQRLLTLIGIKSRIDGDDIFIEGNPMLAPQSKTPLHFDPEDDHRMAMAAALLKKKGFPIEIKNPYCVTKSFPEFWSYIE